MTLDIKSFAGMRREEICKKLKSEGYEILRRGALCSVFHQAGSHQVVRVSMTPKTAAFFCDYMMKNADNPYLPKIYDHVTISEAAHVSLTEKLVSLEELAEEEENYIRLGMARAIASFAFGDQIHQPFHEELAKEKKFIDAVRVLTDCARQSLQQLGSEGECLFLDRDVDGILFRPDSNGQLSPVFANTLCYTTPAAGLETEFDNIMSRLQCLEDGIAKNQGPCRKRGPAVQ